ncbi:MAG TPA: hypothetical protein VGP17_10505 [Solirubrobacteraceae bacterium]|jgi:hypothetical protein|nr:hypothetical protein [Solirubrobacteraceae bacterium]
MPRIRTFMLALLAVTLSAGAGALDASPALASHGQTLFFEAPSELLNPATRGEAIEQMQHLGVKGVRIELSWNAVSPGNESAKRPNFNATEPAAYEWGAYDSLIEEIHALHWQILLTISPPAPRWASSNGIAPYVTRPNDRDFKEFMTAVGRHYGSEVTDYAIWNEPNEYNSLRPQFGAGGAPMAGTIYRGLFEEGYAGLRAAGIKSPRVLMGETAPGGFAKLTKGLPSYTGVAPLAFLRGALCLNASYRKARTCTKLPAYGYAQHPYASNTAGPFYKPPTREDVTIGTLGGLASALNMAGKAGAVNRGLPIFLTEFGVMSKPNLYFGVSITQQAEYDAIAERIAWENPRVAAFSQYLLRDDPLSPEPNVVTFQTGLENANGTKKPLYYGFPVPLTVTYARRGYNLWGYVRPAGKTTSVTVLIQRPHASGYQVLTKLRTGPLGYWTLKSNVRGAHWRVRWTSPTGVLYEGPPIGAYRAP